MSGFRSLELPEAVQRGPASCEALMRELVAMRSADFDDLEREENESANGAVSYTHLTLPTILRV